MKKLLLIVSLFVSAALNCSDEQPLATSTPARSTNPISNGWVQVISPIKKFPAGSYDYEQAVKTFIKKQAAESELKKVDVTHQDLDFCEARIKEITAMLDNKHVKKNDKTVEHLTARLTIFQNAVKQMKK